MALLTKIERVSAGARRSSSGGSGGGGGGGGVGAGGTLAAPAEDRKLNFTFDVGKNVIVLVVAGLALLGMILADDATARDVFRDILVGVLAGGAGIQIGERSGAKEAEEKLKSETGGVPSGGVPTGGSSGGSPSTGGGSGGDNPSPPEF
jgi:hypothetical protein